MSRRMAIMAMVVMLCFPRGFAAEDSREYQVKGVLLFHLTQFVEWPASAFEAVDSPFVIGILGQDPFDKTLTEIVQGEKANSRAIVIKRFDKVESVTNCQVLFVSMKGRDVRKTLTPLKDRPILTVADEDGFIRSGGMIHLFKNSDNKVRLRINLAATKNCGLTVSSKLLRVAEVVRSEED